MGQLFRLQSAVTEQSEATFYNSDMNNIIHSSSRYRQCIRIHTVYRCRCRIRTMFMHMDALKRHSYLDWAWDDLLTYFSGSLFIRRVGVLRSLIDIRVII